MPKVVRGGSARAFAIVLLALAIVMSIASSTYAITIAAESKTDYIIVISSGAIAPEKTAASELQHYLKQVTGAEFPIKTEYEVSWDKPQILVGQSRRVKSLAPDVDWVSLKRDGIIIRTVDNNLILAGGQPRGTLYAVYTFLEDQIGIRWWTSTESTIPVKKTFRVPKLNINYTPKLVSREAHYRDLNENPLFAVKLKMNGHFYGIPAEYGGHCRFLGFVHTSNWFIPPGKYFKDHPEWFSEIDGKRNADNTQLCFTNEEMCKELTSAVLARIAEDPNGEIISISQNDNFANCQCAKCKAVNEEEGSPSGAIIRCINKVAEEIEKQYPDMLVETLAYQFSRKPPLKARPRKNVIVRLCSIECDFSKTLESDANKDFRDDMLGWKAIAPNLFIWDYVTDFRRYVQPHPNMRVLAPNIRFFVKNNTIGLFEQGDSQCSIGDFVRMRAWLFGHLEWDPSRDEKKLMSEFLNGYYGPAAPYLQQYIDLIHDAREKKGTALPCYNMDLSFLTLQIMNQATGLLDKAQEAVAKDLVLSARVRRDRMPLDYVWLVRYYELKKEAETTQTPFAGPKDPAKACRQYIDLAREWNVGSICEGWPFEAEVANLENMFTPVPNPKDFAKLPKEDCIQITPDQFLLLDTPKLAEFVKDPLASTGTAARMPGNHDKYAVQFHITDDLVKRLDGKWKVYLIARCETGSRNPYLRCGFRDKSIDKTVAWFDQRVDKAWDGTYRTYYMGARNLTSSIYIYAAPSGYMDVTPAIYVDRFVLVRDR